MQTIKISGQLTGQDFSYQPEQAFDDILTITCRQEITLEALRSSGHTVELKAIEDDALIELEFEGGFRRWLRAQDVCEQARRETSRDASPAFVLTPASFDTAHQRGAVGLILKCLRLLDIDPLGDLSEAVANMLVERLEKKRIPQPGIYRCADPDELTLTPLQAAGDIDTASPVLLFLHGTFSNTAGSFSELWASRQGYNAPAWLKRLFAPYGQQVLTLEHHTLTVSPVQNALAVLRALPPRTRLHLISHSRGGLVGELLCQGRMHRRLEDDDAEQYIASETIFSEKELALFGADGRRQADLAALQEIAALFKEKQIRVERFARVACPGRGTVLASARLEDNLSVVFNVLNMIPAPIFRELAEFVRMVLMAVAQKRTQPEELPGLEAMMPGSPLIRLLNRHDVQLDSDLTIIAGDVKASGLLGHFKDWVIERFFGEENDYVVNTAGMYGGSRRLGGKMRFYLDQGEDSNHFSYFRNQEVRERLLNALQRPDNDMRLRPVYAEPASHARSVVAGEDDADRQGVVYFIPGFMGSALQAGGRPVWLDMGALGWGDFTRLQMDKPGIKQAGVLESAYRPLLDALDEHHRLVAFGYDWRRSFAESGRRLGDKLEAELDAARAENREPVLRVLAHSSGGLVMLAMMSEMPGVWRRLREEADFRCVMLGTPLQGTLAAVQILLGQHRLLTLLNLLDGQLDAREADILTSQLATYPGLLEMLPQEFLHESPWQAPLGEGFHNWPARRLLPDALRVRQQWQQVELDTQRILYVHGKAALTPDALLEHNGEWRFHAAGEGDGVTLWEQVNSNLPAWYMPLEHGRMASHPDYFPALLYLLDDGFSRQLEQAPPRFGQALAQWLPGIRSELFPDEQELLAAALGYHTRMTQEEIRPAIELRVIHGNLEHVPRPVVVGHYAGDSILSAEAVLDKRLRGSLSELHRIGLYPGELGTSHVFFNPGRKPGGAVVVGLGEVGKLSTSELTFTFMRAMLDYALKIRETLKDELTADSHDGNVIPVHVATLLMGTVGGGSIALADSIAAILRATVQANMALDKTEKGARMRLQIIEFIEVYEDRAVEAARLVQDFVQLPEFSKAFCVRTLMQCLPGKRRRVMYNDPPGWWRRIQIEAGQGSGKNGLKYTTLTDKARAEMLLQATQLKLVDQFIERAISAGHDDHEVGAILFELLLPSAMKEQAPNAEHLVLVLDSEASAYPWELLYNRLDEESRPLAVKFGVVRQLQVGQYRQQVINPVERSALVIGDPPPGNGFVRLEAARKEAVAVAGLLEAGGFNRVVREIGSDPQSILKSLHTGDYRVLHLAGHGVYRYQPDKDSDLLVSGMVLGDGIFLTPVEIGQMRRVPELAFINCCHLAQMDFMEAAARNAVTQERTRLAASLAQELIRMGVRAVIAAGWAIDDNAAQVFAETCYSALLKGYPFGQAVLIARRATWERYPDNNTWGAYQCYGDPDYKLLSREPGGDNGNTGADSWQFVAEAEVVAELHNLINAADTAQTGDFAWLQGQIKHLHRAIPAEWLGHAEILYALGRAYGKLDMFAEALEAYDAALASRQAGYPVILLEDKVSLQTAWALGWAQGKLTPPDVRKAASPGQLMDDSLQTLRLLAGLGNSLQRLEETGKFWKRKAMMVTGVERVYALEQMEQAYHLAHEFALQESRQVAGYPLVNWLTCKLVRYLRGHVPTLDRQAVKYWLDQGRQGADSVDRTEPSFCSGITRAECHLLQYILGARLNENARVQQVVNDYERAVARGAAPRQLRFVAEHLAFLRLMLGEFQQEKTHLQPVVMALLEIEEKLNI